MIDERRLLLQVAREVANTFMPPGLPPEQRVAEHARALADLIGEDAAVPPTGDAVDPGTDLRHGASMLPVLSRWIAMAAAEGCDADPD